MSAKPFVAATALIFGLGAVGAGAAVAGVSAQAPAAATGQSGAKPQDRSRRVCRSQVPVGTRLAVRTCRTAEEWENEARRSSDDLHTQQRDGIREPEKPQPL
jgi:hypothetical protein